MKLLIRALSTAVVALVLILQTSCSTSKKFERYTYVRPGWVHGKGHKQCISYSNTKPVKRSYYFRIQKFEKEF